MAPSLFAALHRCSIRMRNGVSPEAALSEAVKTLEGAGFRTVEYIEAVDPGTLDTIAGSVPAYPCRLIAAAWMGRTRLIDNIEL